MLPQANVNANQIPIALPAKSSRMTIRHKSDN